MVCGGVPYPRTPFFWTSFNSFETHPLDYGSLGIGVEAARFGGVRGVFTPKSGINHGKSQRA